MIVTPKAARAVLRTLTLGVLCFGHTHAWAAPWAEVGDVQLRSDIETLATAGVIDNLTTEWPVPWTRILDRLAVSGALNGQPSSVVDAAERIRHQAAGQMVQDTTSFSAYFDATNAPEVVRGFDALGRQNAQTQGTLAWNGESTFMQLSAGLQSHDSFDSHTVLLDGTYIARQIYGAAVYAGYLTHWWGPGWISALSLSNNAAPIPQIGISRIDTSPFKSRWLSWLGPWQAEFFVGVLEGDMLPTHTLIDGLRFNFNPAPGLDIGLERMDEACGRGHPCNPANYFNLSNSPTNPSKTNDQGDIDIKYSRELGAVALSAYLQVMNEDSNPFYHSGTSHLFGLTGWVPVGQRRVRITAEFTDSIATQQIFGFGDYFYGFAYNDYKYLGGMRNWDRALGFSLDTDAKLATLQASWLDAHNITWTLSYHHADLNVAVPTGATAYSLINFVSSAPVPINIGQVRASFALLDHFAVDVEARYSSDQPRPAHGSQGAGEVRLRYSL
ncbi:MAG TPA: capsule assembly Wzi family protein [Steroidobacteraceae bacterium]